MVRIVNRRRAVLSPLRGHFRPEHAAARDIKINTLACRPEGDIDLRGFLGISEAVPVGFKEILVSVKIDADIFDGEKEEIDRVGAKTFTRVP